MTTREQSQRLYELCSKGQGNEVAELISVQGLNVNEQLADFQHATPLHIAAGFGRLGVIDVLLSLGATGDVKDTKGFVALHNACAFGHLDVARALIRHNPDTIMAQNDEGNTPLHLAAAGGHEGTCLAILRGGNARMCPWALANNEGMVPLQYAQSDTIKGLLSEDYKSVELEKYAQSGKIASLEAVITPLNVNHRFKHLRNASPLHLAAGFNHRAAVALLIEHGADINAKDDSGMTSLHSAASFGHLSVVRLLIAGGADINAQDLFGFTALHEAASNNRIAVFSALVRAGADATVCNKDGNTPLNIQQDPTIAQSLKEEFQEAMSRKECESGTASRQNSSSSRYSNDSLGSLVGSLEAASRGHRRVGSGSSGLGRKDRSLSRGHRSSSSHSRSSQSTSRSASVTAAPIAYHPQNQHQQPQHQVQRRADSRSRSHSALVTGSSVTPHQISSRRPNVSPLRQESSSRTLTHRSNGDPFSSQPIPHANQLPLANTTSATTTVTATTPSSNSGPYYRHARHQRSASNSGIPTDSRGDTRDLMRSAHDEEEAEPDPFPPQPSSSSSSDFFSSPHASQAPSSRADTRKRSTSFPSQLYAPSALGDLLSDLMLPTREAPSTTTPSLAPPVSHHPSSGTADERIYKVAYKAACEGDIGSLQPLLLKYPELLKASSHFSPRSPSLLHAAAGRNQLRVLEALIASGADPNTRDKGGMVALHSASCFGHMDAVNYLLTQANANVNAADNWGYTPLHEACRKQQASVVDALVAHGAVEMRANDGRLPSSFLANANA